MPAFVVSTIAQADTYFRAILVIGMLIDELVDDLEEIGERHARSDS
jgi:hypothetical protein